MNLVSQCPPLAREIRAAPLPARCLQTVGGPLRLARLSALLIATACSPIRVPGYDAGPTDAAEDAAVEQIVADIQLDGLKKIDLLFVIDDSSTMAEEQESLATGFNRLVEILSGRGFGRPSLHIGVTSTNLGSGPFVIPACAGSGDNGRLLPGACLPRGGEFIVDVNDPTGGRVINYSGTLEETFGCMARLGVEGCGFERPLEAMRRALDGTNPSNDGFLRDDADLVVVFVSDEDDCSASNTAIYDPSQTALGPITSFRCFEFGVHCSPDDPRSPGEKTDCLPREDSSIMTPVAEYENFLRDLKPPGNVVVAAIAGNPGLVIVGTSDNGNPELEPSCTSASGDAVPAVRLDALVSAFPGRGATESICNEDLSEAIASIAKVVDGAIGSPCLYGSLHDADPAPGIQPLCKVIEVGPDDSERELPACDSSSGSPNKPCHVLTEEAVCSHTATGLFVSTQRDDVSPPGSRLIVRCTKGEG